MPNVERTLIALAIVSHIGLLVVGILIWGALVHFSKLISQLGVKAMEKAMSQGAFRAAAAPQCGIHQKELMPDGLCAACLMEDVELPMHDAFGACVACKNGRAQLPSGSTCTECGRHW